SRCPRATHPIAYVIGPRSYCCRVTRPPTLSMRYMWGEEPMEAFSESAAGSMIYAADKYSRGLGARSAHPDGGGLRGTEALAARERGLPALRDALPAGYVPLDEVKDLTLLGRWPLLEDRMSACMPTRIISGMEHRRTAGDHEAEAWLK